MAADVKWLGTAVAVAQVDSLTVGGTIEAGDVFNITVTGTNGRTLTISVSASSTSIPTTVAEIVAAWNASTDALCKVITAADADPIVTLTADTPGDAFTVTVETTEAGGGAADAQTFVRAATTANGGPKDWRDVDNWDLGALPGSAADHTVYIENFTGDIVYGLDQSGLTVLAALNIGASFVGKLGDNGSAGTVGDYLQILTSILNIGNHFGAGAPTGSGRIKVNTLTDPCEISVYKTGSAFDSGKPAVRLLADDVATNLTVYRGSVGVAYESTETSSINDVNILWTSNRATDSSVYINEDVTIGGSLTKTGGTCILQVAVATITHSSGTLNIRGSGATTTFNISGGTVSTVSTGNITTVNITAGTFSADGTGTVGTLNITGGNVTLKDTGNITTITGSSGTITITGTATIGTMTAEGSVIYSESTGTITTMTITGGTVNFTGSLAARTVTTPKLDAPGKLSYDPAVVTMTAKIDSDNPVTLTAA